MERSANSAVLRGLPHRGGSRFVNETWRLADQRPSREIYLILAARIGFFNLRDIIGTISPRPLDQELTQLI
jgi:hypothetical protein